MDQRVTDLWNRLNSPEAGDQMSLGACRDEVLTLHAAITDEESRIGLMGIFHEVCDQVAFHFKREGRDIAALENERRIQIWKFLRAESLMAPGVPHPPTLLHVTTREITAGRMTEDDEMHRYALFLMTKWEECLARSQPEDAQSGSVH
jgi:hypothetical protein